MRPVKAKVTKALQVGSELKVVDNSGAKRAEIISVLKYKSTRKRLPKAGVGDIVVVAIKEGSIPGMQKNVAYAVIVRQRKEYRRYNGVRVKFEDNACVILKDLDSLEPRGSVIKGPVAREVVERFPAIGKVATIIV
jgi:large subunit ribosomal protein L14